MQSLHSILKEVKTNSRLQLLESFCSTSNIVLYGAGLTCAHILDALIKNGVRPIMIADDTPSKQGKLMQGIPIVPLTEVQKIKQPYALIVTMLNPEMNFSSIKIHLEGKGIANVFSFIELLYVYPSQLLPYFHFDQPESLLKHSDLIKKAFELFEDETSKDLFLRNLVFRLELAFDVIPKGDKDPYFPDSILNGVEESIFFDCGAYDGDTVKTHLSRFGKSDAVYAFEPDPENYKKLVSFCSGLEKGNANKIYSFNYGISDGHGYLKFNSLNNMASSLDAQGNMVIQTISLDEFFYPILKNYPNTIFIKMDIEGAEPKALEGCKELIAKKTPHLAISSYHNPDDLWNLPLYIYSLNSRYKFYLRQHGNDSMDLVLYAVGKS